MIVTGGVSDRLVRLAGQPESGRRPIEMVRAIASEGKDRFDQESIAELPPRSARGRQRQPESLSSLAVRGISSQKMRS